eukprot:5564396-Alexandrium_andersonii.AAC.1
MGTTPPLPWSVPLASPSPAYPAGKGQSSRLARNATLGHDGIITHHTRAAPVYHMLSFPEFETGRIHDAANMAICRHHDSCTTQ